MVQLEVKIAGIFSGNLFAWIKGQFDTKVEKGTI